MAKKKNQVIKDPNLEPYFIEQNARGFIVKENKHPNPNFKRTTNPGVPYQKVVQYRKSIPGCLKTIIDLKMKDKGDFHSIEHYLKEYNKCRTKIENINLNLNNK